MAASTEITEQITYGGSPGAPNAAATALPALTATVTARADREYVAGRYPDAVENYLRTLPPAIDDLTADFGDDVYERVMLDAHVAAEVAVLKASILETGVNLSPAKPDKTDDGHARSVEIRDLAERMFEDLATPLDDVLWDLTGAITTGNKVAELTYRLDGGRLLLDRMAVKPRRSVAFVVDAFQHLVGFLAAIPGVAWNAYGGMLVGDLIQLPNFLPREKFAVWTHRPRDGNPLGTSILRPIHNAWWLKAQLWGEYLKYLTQFAGPSLVGFTAPNAQAMPDPTNPAVSLTPQQFMQRALAEIRNGGAAAFASGADVKPLLVPGNGEAFLQAFALLNREITKGILLQNLATQEGQHQSRSASQVHQDVLDTIVRQGKRSVVRMIRYDVLRPWVRFNWGEAAVALTPQVTLGETEQTDFATELTAISSGVRYGYIHRSQFVGLDDRLGLPARDPEWESDPGPPITQVTAQRVPALQGEGDPAAPPAPVPGQPAQQPQAVAA